MTKKDFNLSLVIGAAVGLLIQPIIANLVAAPSLLLRVAVFFGLFIFAPFALWIASLLGKVWGVLYQFAIFAAVGTMNSFADLGIFNLETFLYGAEPSVWVFRGLKSISFLLSTANSYFWNKFWTFNSGGTKGAGEVVKFYTIAIAGFLLNVGAASFVYQTGGAESSSPLWLNIVSPIAGIFAAMIWNFLGYKFIVFKKKEEVLSSPS